MSEYLEGVKICPATLKCIPILCRISIVPPVYVVGTTQQLKYISSLKLLIKISLNLISVLGRRRLAGLARRCLM